MTLGDLELWLILRDPCVSLGGADKFLKLTENGDYGSDQRRSTKVFVVTLVRGASRQALSNWGGTNHCVTCPPISVITQEKVPQAWWAHFLN